MIELVEKNGVNINKKKINICKISVGSCFRWKECWRIKMKLILWWQWWYAHKVVYTVSLFKLETNDLVRWRFSIFCSTHLYSDIRFIILVNSRTCITTTTQSLLSTTGLHRRAKVSNVRLRFLYRGKVLCISNVRMIYF